MDTEKEIIKEEVTEQVEEESSDIDFEELVKTRVEEAVKPLQETISELTNKYNELLEESKKKRTIKINTVKKESPEERLEREAESMYQNVKNLII